MLCYISRCRRYIQAQGGAQHVSINYRSINGSEIEKPCCPYKSLEDIEVQREVFPVNVGHSIDIEPEWDIIGVDYCGIEQ